MSAFANKDSLIPPVKPGESTSFPGRTIIRGDARKGGHQGGGPDAHPHANIAEEHNPGDFCSGDFCGDQDDACPPLWRRLLSKVPAVLGVVLLVAAIVVIWRELHHISMRDVGHALATIPSQALMAGGGATLLSYFVLSFYDYLACAHVRTDVSYRRAAFAAFCSYVLSHNLGCAAISGAAVRFRLYRNWGVSSGRIAQIIAFCSTTYLLGTLALVGSILLLEPDAVPAFIHLPLSVLRLIGSVCWAGLVAYLVLSRARRRFYIRGHAVEIPRTRIAFSQIFVSAADMAATALIAYAVLPPLPHDAHFGFGTFLAIYIASYTAGLLASVPGGLGVFDGAMLFALQPYLPVAKIMSAILIFRLFYYILPLVLAGVMFATHEIFMRSEQALISAGQVRKRIRPSQVVLESEADFSVAVASGMQATIGVLLVIYMLAVQLPPQHEAFMAAVAQMAGLLLTVSGVALVGLALGLRQRVAMAWKVSVGVLAASIVLLFLRNAPWLSALVLALMILLLLPFQNCYYRRAHLLSAPLTPFMLAPVTLWGLGLLGVGWVAMQRHLGPIWWRAMIYDAHTATGRWCLGLSAVFGLVALRVGMRRARIRFDEWSIENAGRYRNLPHALQDFGPCEPTGLLLDEAGKAAIPFCRSGQFIIGIGDPAGAERNAIAAIWRLRDLALQEGKRLAFVGVGPTLMAVYNDLGLTVSPSGERGMICCLTGDYRRIKAYFSGQDRLARRQAARNG